MAAYISFQPSDYYTTHIYAGTSSAPFAQTGIGFQPDTVWTKPYDYTDPIRAVNSVRGGDYSIKTSSDAAEQTGWTPAAAISAWGADGYTIGTNDGGFNSSSYNYVGWCWKGGTTSGITTNGSTTITPAAYSFSTTAGISILKYEGNSTAGAKLAHGLGVAPQQIILKKYAATEPWAAYNIGVGGYLDPEDYGKSLNTNGAKDNDISYWNDTKPDSVNITLGDGAVVNQTSQDYIAYVFAPVKGFSKFGCYRGNNNNDGPFIYTGFRPGFIMIKSDDSSTNWAIFDDKRSLYTGNDYAIQLWANDDAVPATDQTMEMMSNGFKISRTNTYSNASGAVITYMAFAEFPTVSSNDIPGTAR